MTEHHDSHCPSPEELDSLSSEAIRQHVSQCPVCQERLAAYRKIDKAIQSLMEPPSGLEARIRQAVHSGKTPSIPDSAPRRFFWKPFLALAASVAILACISILNIPEDQEPSGEIVEVPVVYQEENPSDFHISLQGSRQQTPVRLVGLGGQNSHANDMAVSRRAALPGQISHVWTCRNPDAVIRKIQNLDAMRDSVSILSSQKNGNGVASFQLLLEDRDLQDLVDRLSGTDCELLSPFLPQPNHREKVAFSGRNVEYTLKLVPEE